MPPQPCAEWVCRQLLLQLLRDGTRCAGGLLQACMGEALHSLLLLLLLPPPPVLKSMWLRLCTLQPCLALMLLLLVAVLLLLLPPPVLQCMWLRLCAL
jgi:hypothetical protein